MKKLLCSTLFLISLNTFAAHTPFFNMAYVEVNDHKLSTAACYTRADNGKPFFDMVGIFAANINGSNPDKPVIYFNSQVDGILNHSDAVSKLQAKGIKVLLTLLGNHQNAGWACMSDETGIQEFADKVVKTVHKYHLDGIDIDDEYSNCASNNTSLIRVAKAIKEHPGFKGKLLTKALFSDSYYFAATYNGHKLSDYLDYGWEMSYGYANYEARLRPYMQYGVAKELLSLGVSTHSDAKSASQAAQYSLAHHHGGLMVYDVKENSRDYLSELAKTEFNTTVKTEPNCE